MDAPNCKQHESCFVFQQTTGLVGLAVCETPHEVCTSFFFHSWASSHLVCWKVNRYGYFQSRIPTHRKLALEMRAVSALWSGVCLCVMAFFFSYFFWWLFPWHSRRFTRILVSTLPNLYLHFPPFPPSHLFCQGSLDSLYTLASRRYRTSNCPFWYLFSLLVCFSQ